MGLFSRKTKKTAAGDDLGKGLMIEIVVGFGKITKSGFTYIHEVKGKPGTVHLQNGKNQVTAKLAGIEQHNHRGKYLGKVDLQLESPTGLRYSITIKADNVMLVALSSIGI